MSRLNEDKLERILYVDCFAGIAGDMMLGALLDLDLPAQAIKTALDALPLKNWFLHIERVQRSGIVATRAHVQVDENHQPVRSYQNIVEILKKADLEIGVRRRALAIFKALAEAEGHIHNVPLEKVHFHEVGAVDSIIDIVGVAAGLEHLESLIHCAIVPVGRGFVDCQHGKLPIPAPASLALLKDLPITGTDIDAELVTPTGAAILKTQVTEYGPLPPMRPKHIGWGAGQRDHADRPGLLRLIWGEPLIPNTQSLAFDHVILEANIDDMTPEIAAYALNRALSAGALDGWITPITMKKGRPAIKMSLLARSADRDTLTALLLAETTTIGLRYHEVGRVELPRQTIVVTTPYGVIPVKISGYPEEIQTVSPEFEACRKAAEEKEVPLKEVLAAATVAARRTLPHRKEKS